jgi:arginase family enzyme
MLTSDQTFEKMRRNVKVFGAALDASDFPLTIQMKLNYLNKLAEGLVKESDFLDPYDGLLKLSKLLSNDFFKKVGTFPIESWLSPRPNLEDIHLINQITFQNFTNAGNIRKYSEKLKEFIQNKIFPDIPLMIGVDHSLTGGALKAVSQKVGNNDLLVVVFDAHFDGLPANISLNIAKYANEHPEALNPLIVGVNLVQCKELNLKDTYSCASFLYYLLKDKTILPENLIIFGCQDYPNEEYRSIDDSRIKKYVAFFDKIEQSGVNFIPANEPSKMIEDLNQIINKLNAKNLYLSFDVDVCSLKEVIATRFRNVIGIDKSTIINATKVINKFIKSKRVVIEGLDIMEIETYLLNKNFPKSNRKDETIGVINNYLEVLFFD